MIHAEVIIIHAGDIMSTLRDVQHIRIFSISLMAFINELPYMNHDMLDVLMVSPQCILDIPQCTQHLPICSSYSPT